MAENAGAAQEVLALAEAAHANGAVRTCIGCRKKAARNQLIRLVRSVQSPAQAVVKVDLLACMPGRGAWLHPSPECWQLAIKRRAISRALPGAVDDGDVELFAQKGLLSQVQ